MADIATLAIKVDASQVSESAKELDALSNSSEQAEASTKKMGDNWRQNMAGVAKSMRETYTASNILSKETQTLLNRYDPLGTKLRSLQSDLALLRKEMGGSNSDATIKTFEGLENEIVKTKALMADVGTVTEKSAGAFDNLEFNSQRARRSLLMLGREVMTGNFAQMPQTLGSLAVNSNLLSVLMTPLGLGIAAAAAATIGLGVAMYQGSKEVENMNRALNLTGNFAGLTAQSMHDLAAESAKIGSITIGGAKEIALALASSGEIGSGAFKSVMAASAAYAHATGEDASKVSGVMIKMFSDPAKGADELNKTMHHLSMAQTQAIHDLQDMGDKEGAATLAATLLREELDKHPTTLNKMGEAMQRVKGFMSSMWDTFTGGASSLLNARSLTDQLKDTEFALSRISKDSVTYNDLLKERAGLIAKIAEAETKAKADAAEAAKNAADAEILSYARGISDVSKKLELVGKIEQLNTSKKTAESGSNAELILLDAIKKTQEEINNIGKGERTAQYNADLSDIKQKSASVVDTLTNAEKVLSAFHTAAQTTDRQYYAEKIASIAAISAAKSKGINDEIEKEQELLKSGKLNAAEMIAQKSKIHMLQSQQYLLSNDEIAQIKILGIEEEASLRKITLAYIAAQKAANDYLATVNRKNEREIKGIGQGDYNRTLAAGTNQIEDRQIVAIQALQARRASMQGNMTKKMYDDELAIIKDTYNAEIMMYENKSAKILASQQNWINGATDAIYNYAYEIANVAKATENAMTKAFHGMEDALVSFVRTGKADFRALANSIIDDIIRIQLRQGVSSIIGGNGGVSGLISSGVSWLSGSSSTPTPAGSDNNVLAGARAGGGDVSGGSSYLVGEQGPEIITPRTNGTVIPNNKLGGGDVTLQVNVINNASQQVSATPQQNDSGGFDLIIEQIEGKIAGNISRGTGSLNSSISHTFGLNRVAGAF